jgi:hypothetical protein
MQPFFWPCRWPIAGVARRLNRLTRLTRLSRFNCANRRRPTPDVALSARAYSRARSCGTVCSAAWSRGSTAKVAPGPPKR